MNPAEPKILIVDDSEENRYTLARRLEREGYSDLHFAEHGEAALAELSDGGFDLVLLDIMMPVMDGHETLRRIKADMTLREVPVIMISAVDELDSVVRCIDHGAEDFLPKPFNTSLLRARIRASLARKRFRDQEIDYLRRIEEEKQRVDELLQASWPAGAIRELKTTQRVRPRRFEDVTVLFCDIVDFTAYCDSHTPEEVVAHLEQMVDLFERITARHGLEKIKSIGDAFLATGGLLEHLDFPAASSLRCGLEMAKAARELTAGWELRVGIHMGPVVAGMMGKRSCAFDLWGDTVNVAARIMQQADAGTVLVSGVLWPQLRAQFTGESKGFVDLKGKGQVELIAARERS